MDVISLLVGCIIGDANAMQRQGVDKKISTRVRFRQSIIHKDYIFYLYNFLHEKGYCSNAGPSYYTVTNKVKDGKKEYNGYAFATYSFSSLNWLYDIFYKDGVKILSSEIEKYFTALSLAVLIMDDGGWVKTSKSLRISVNAFTLVEVELLVHLLKEKFGLDCTIQKRSKPKGDLNYVYKEKYNIYFLVKSVPLLQTLVKPYMHPSMYYKIGL